MQHIQEGKLLSMNVWTNEEAVEHFGGEEPGFVPPISLRVAPSATIRYRLSFLATGLSGRAEASQATAEESTARKLS